MPALMLSLPYLPVRACSSASALRRQAARVWIEGNRPAPAIAGDNTHLPVDLSQREISFVALAAASWVTSTGSSGRAAAALPRRRRSLRRVMGASRLPRGRSRCHPSSSSAFAPHPVSLAADRWNVNAAHVATSTRPTAHPQLAYDSSLDHRRYVTCLLHRPRHADRMPVRSDADRGASRAGNSSAMRPYTRLLIGRSSRSVTGTETLHIFGTSLRTTRSRSTTTSAGLSPARSQSARAGPSPSCTRLRADSRIAGSIQYRPS